MPRPLVERLLAPVADVRREEAASALLMTVLLFLLLAAYYLLKTAREVLILTEGGAEIKSYSSAAQAMLLLVLVPAYGAFASRVNPLRLVTIVTLFFASHLLLFIAAIGAGWQVGIGYFFWVGIFNLMVIAQFWAFATDLYTEEQGKRLFALIGIGGSLGAWLGSVRAGTLVESQGPARLLGTAFAILVVCAALVPVVRALTTRAAARKTATVEAPLTRQGGFALVRSDRYLGSIALLMLFVNVVNTTGEYLFGRYVVEQSYELFAGAGAAAVAAREQFVGETYARLFSTVNLAGLLMQMFLVSRLIKWFGLERSLFIHPFVAFVGYLLLLRAPSLPLIGIVKVADNSLDYSLGNTTRQALWLPTTREAKYKAKQVIDSLFVRTGDVLSAGIVFGGERLALAVPAFAAVNLLLVAGWLAVVVRLTRLRAHTVSTHPA